MSGFDQDRSARTLTVAKTIFDVLSKNYKQHARPRQMPEARRVSGSPVVFGVWDSREDKNYTIRITED